MKKLLLTTAALSLLASNAALADPAIMVGLSVNLGGMSDMTPGITAKLLSSDKQDEAVAAAGVTFFPGADTQFGADLSAGYNFNEGAALIGYDLLNHKVQASGGWVNTREEAEEEVIIGPSDIRFKRDIRLLASLESGLKLYSYRYIWSETFFVGVMAQDLLKAAQWRGAVVRNANGFFNVNYTMLGLRMATLDEWEAQGMAAVMLQDARPAARQAMLALN